MGCDTGLLQPLLIPSGVWHNIAMDFIEGLPKSGRNDIIWVIVDRMSKYAYFIALAHPLTAATLAQMFIDQTCRLYGAPANIMSDKGLYSSVNFGKNFSRN